MTVAVPPHVSADRIRDVNIYALPGQGLASAEVAITIEEWETL